MRARRLRRAAAAVLTIVAAAIGYLAFIGYFGGAVFLLVPAQGVPPEAERGTVAVLFSGDMGFRAGMAPRVARRLAAQGIPVIGANTLTAFASRRDPAQAAALVADGVRRALTLPGARRVLLIGQSFGANIALAGAAAMPPALRKRVALIELVVPADTMLFRATPGGILDLSHDGPAMPFARRVADLPVLCVHGETEEDSLCPAWRQRNVRTVTLPGDHYLQHDDLLVATTLLRALRTMAPAAGIPTRSGTAG